MRIFRSFYGGRRLMRAKNDDKSCTAAGKKMMINCKVCLKWIRPVHEALNYFHRYHRFSQGMAIAAVFCSWNLILYASIIGTSHQLSTLAMYIPNIFFCSVLAISALLVGLQHLPLPNYLYFLTPIWLISIAFNIMMGQNAISTQNFLPQSLTVPKWSKAAQMAIKFCLAAFSMALMISVFFERAVLSVLFMAISPFFIIANRGSRKNINWHLAWICLCLLLAAFPQLPSVGGSPGPFLVVLSELLISAALRLYLAISAAHRANSPWPILLIYRIHLFTAALLFIASLITSSSSPLWIRPFAWCSLPISFLLPILAKCPHIMDRLILWIASLQLPFSFLSLGHEALFLPVFCVFLLLYVRLEHPQWDIGQLLSIQLEKIDEFLPTNDLTAPDWLRALFLVASIEMAFFGTGNIASLNSFNPSFLRHFLSVFSPFTMALLLLLKVLIPFLAVSLCFVAATDLFGTKNPAEHRQNIGRLSALVALITNTMAMTFFFFLRTDGSWLQIGISISNYVICLCCSAFIYLLLHLSKTLLLI